MTAGTAGSIVAIHVGAGVATGVMAGGNANFLRHPIVSMKCRLDTPSVQSLACPKVGAPGAAQATKE